MLPLQFGLEGQCCIWRFLKKIEAVSETILRWLSSWRSRSDSLLRWFLVKRGAVSVKKKAYDEARKPGALA
jgi:hypothetical protein